MKVFGGMLFENLVNNDAIFEFQMGLFNEGIIDGCQIQLCHPSFFPKTDAKGVLALLNALPSQFEVFIHFPGENRGVDVGIRFDERGVFNAYRENNPHARWATFNGQAFSFGRRILEGCERSIRPFGVSHCGYATQQAYESSPLDVRQCATSFLEVYSRYLVLETLPPIIRREWVDGWYCPDRWPSPIMRCFGGTPECMERHLARANTRLLIDFSHLGIIANQVAGDHVPGVTERRLGRYEGVLAAYMALPHCDVCHFSGVPPAGQLVPTHEYFDQPIPEAALEAMKTMQVICLEIPWNDQSRERIARFRDTTGF